MTRLLRAAGFDALLFGSAERLLESPLGMTADCCIIDLGLPGMSGFELRSALEHAHAHCPVVFMTGNDTPRTRDRADASNAVAYLVKPIPGKLLIETVMAALGPRRQPR